MYKVRKLSIRDPGYPNVLKQIFSPPKLLYHYGDLITELNNSEKPSVAIVGSRRSSLYGQKMARQLGKGLSMLGIAVISGLAEGIDAAAHQGALDGGGRTIAVLGCGLDIIYPRINSKLFNRIKEDGGVITEYPPGTPPRRQNFPARNRIISGLSKAVIVVEGSKKSGTLITADFALDQGREVLAVPGPATSALSRAPHKLLKAGARLVEDVSDVLDELGLSEEGGLYTNRETNHLADDMKDLSSDEVVVLKILSSKPHNLDDISKMTQLHISVINSILVKLEVCNMISRSIDGRYFAY